ncbi:UDP-glucose 4-epimerase [Alkalibacillus flavidus]|uniref:UDP-glucose 4-epimerase n=1 Tax=Alkalibacillus flavidus TaxID=546021 RepID=A0ABV2KTZ4_9BACI
MNVLITGAMGYIGQQIVTELMRRNETSERPWHIVATDIKSEPTLTLTDDVTYIPLDIRSPELSSVIAHHTIDVVIHLATIVTPSKTRDRDFEYSVDVEGTHNLLQACITNHVKRIIVSSSGAAYGYHPDNADWIAEDHPLRGNEAFTYAYHKRLVEQMLADYREHHPDLEQIVFRIGTILGDNVNNQITDLFKKPRLLGVKGSNSPFVFIWDKDVVTCCIRAIDSDVTGVYNLAGDGAVTIDDIGDILNKGVVRLPSRLFKNTLWLLSFFRLTQYGPEQLDFFNIPTRVRQYKIERSVRIHTDLYVTRRV